MRDPGRLITDSNTTDVKITVLNDYSREIMLYAKGRYQKNNLFDDLKKIIGFISSVEPSKVSMSVVYAKVEETFVKFKEFREATKAFLSINDMIECMIDTLNHMQIKDRSDGVIIDLGEPNPKIMGLLNENKK